VDQAGPHGALQHALNMKNWSGSLIALISNSMCWASSRARKTMLLWIGLVGATTLAAQSDGMGTMLEEAMAVVIFVVRANVTKDKEAAFNKWYNEEHVPQLLRYNGAVSARRYRKILGDEKYEYMAVYEFANEAIFEKFQKSDYIKELIKEYDANFGEVSQRERSAYVQLWPA
jgi:hypothetical protein